MHAAAYSEGTRFGRYQISALLGSGGMGQVYRARDTRLSRDVALKILHAESSATRGGPAALRFEREARAASALNHPNIVAIFDIGSEGDTTYIIMELVTGRSLRLRLEQGNLPFKKRLKYLHENGVLVMSIFLVGLDIDTPEYLRDLPDLVHEVGVDVPVFSFAAPIEKTTLYRELQQAGRLLPGNILGGMDGAHLTYHPRNIPADELEMALYQCMKRAYSVPRVMQRMVRSWSYGLWSGFANTAGNLFYAPYQRALARSIQKRVQQRGPWPGLLRQETLSTLPDDAQISPVAGD